MTLDLYQVTLHYSDGNTKTLTKDCADIIFRPYDLIKNKSKINKNNYDLVNTFTVDTIHPMEALETMFNKFNSNEGYSHRSMTTSDVVAIHSELEGTVYCYCDFCGWVRLKNF